MRERIIILTTKVAAGGGRTRTKREQVAEIGEIIIDLSRIVTSGEVFEVFDAMPRTFGVVENSRTLATRIYIQ